MSFTQQCITALHTEARTIGADVIKHSPSLYELRGPETRILCPLTKLPSGYYAWDSTGSLMSDRQECVADSSLIDSATMIWIYSYTPREKFIPQNERAQGHVIIVSGQTLDPTSVPAKIECGQLFEEAVAATVTGTRSVQSLDTSVSYPDRNCDIDMIATLHDESTVFIDCKRRTCNPSASFSLDTYPYDRDMWKQNNYHLNQNQLQNLSCDSGDMILGVTEWANGYVRSAIGSSHDQCDLYMYEWQKRGLTGEPRVIVAIGGLRGTDVCGVQVEDTPTTVMCRGIEYMLVSADMLPECLINMSFV